MQLLDDYKGYFKIKSEILHLRLQYVHIEEKIEC